MYEFNTNIDTIIESDQIVEVLTVPKGSLLMNEPGFATTFTNRSIDAKASNNELVCRLKN